MDPDKRPSLMDEQAPSLFGWVRGGLGRTQDEAEINPHIGRASAGSGQVNVGVSQPGRRGLRVPRLLVIWGVLLVLGLVAVGVLVPFLSGVVESIDEGFSQLDSVSHDGGVKKHSDSGAGTVTTDREPRVRESRRVPETPPVQSYNLDDLNRISECVTAAGSDVDRIVKCTGR